MSIAEIYETELVDIEKVKKKRKKDLFMVIHFFYATSCSDKGPLKLHCKLHEHQAIQNLYKKWKPIPRKMVCKLFFSVPSFFFPRPLLIMNKQEIITEGKSPPGDYFLWRIFAQHFCYFVTFELSFL